MTGKPEHLSPSYAAQFQDESVAAAYPNRHPYPAELFDILDELVVDQPRVVLDLGCGAGDVARPIAERVTRVDAVDPSRAMIEIGRSLSGGDDSRIRWICSPAEQFGLPGPYALVVAAESLHWMDWHAVLPKIRDSLTPHGQLALVRRASEGRAWGKQQGGVIARYSTNRDYQPYDLLQELATRGLFVAAGRKRTELLPFRQTIDDYIESYHSKNGLSRQRMGAEAAADFDREMRRILEPHANDGWLEYRVGADVAWGRPEPA